MKSIPSNQTEKIFNESKEQAESNTEKVFNTNNKKSSDTANVFMILGQFITELIIKEITMDEIINDLVASIVDNEIYSPHIYKAIEPLINEQARKTLVINKLIQEVKVLSPDTKNANTEGLADNNDLIFYELSDDEFSELQEASMLLGKDTE